VLQSSKTDLCQIVSTSVILKRVLALLAIAQTPIGRSAFHHRHIKREFLGFYRVAYPKACLGRFLRFHLPTGPILVTEWLALKKIFPPHIRIK